jgi:hypothetical protein
MLAAALVSAFGGFALIAVFALGMLRAGLRSGDRPGDATVTAGIRRSGQPDEPRPVIIVTVRNPALVPVLVGFSVARDRALAPMSVRVPRRTTRRRFRAAAQDVVGVVPAAGIAELPVPVPVRARRYLLTAVIGQSGGRLRVFRVPVTDRRRRGEGGVAVTRPCLDDGRLT